MQQAVTRLPHIADALVESGQQLVIAPSRKLLKQ